MSEETNEFPSIEGNNLNKEKKVVPDDFVDKDLIIIVAFQQWHQGLVDQSINLLEKLSTKPYPNGFLAELTIII